MKLQHRKHISIHRNLVMHLVEQQDDWRTFLPGFEGTREEALTALRDGPEYLCSCDCPKEADGSCAGRKVEVPEGGAP